jgi:hypothetical protein
VKKKKSSFKINGGSNMENYNITEPTQSIMAELDPIIVGRIVKSIPYLAKFILYMLSGCLYIAIFYLVMLVIGGII